TLTEAGVKNNSQRRLSSGTELHRLGEIQPFQPAIRAAEALNMNAHAIPHGQEELAHRSLSATHNSSAGLEGSARAASDERRQIFMQVPVAIRKPGAVHNHRVVEQR